MFVNSVCGLPTAHSLHYSGAAGFRCAVDPNSESGGRAQDVEGLRAVRKLRVRHSNLGCIIEQVVGMQELCECR